MPSKNILNFLSNSLFSKISTPLKPNYNFSRTICAILLTYIFRFFTKYLCAVTESNSEIAKVNLYRMCLKEFYTMCSFLLLIPFSLQLAVTKVTGVKCSTDVLYREGWYDRKPFCSIHLHRIRYFRRNHRKVFPISIFTINISIC